MYTYNNKNLGNFFFRILLKKQGYEKREVDSSE